MDPRANSLAAKDIQNLLHPYTNLEKHEEIGPLVVTHGKGIHVFDDEGTAYIEAMSGLWCASLGFGEEALVEAAAKQMRELPFYHGFSHKSHPAQIELAEKLLETAPVPMSKVYFAGSGSAANDTAVKMVWYYNNALGRPKKKKIIARLKGYHGVTVAAGSLTGLPYVQNAFDLPIQGILHTDCPHYYREAEEGESEEAFASRIADNLEKMILAEDPDTVAAFIAEPVMGAGGVILPPVTYFPKVKAVLDKYDVLMIADEVICGHCRTGNYWGSETFQVQPDILTTAKALSSAYLPISAVMVNHKVFDVLKKMSGQMGMFGHGHTYSGHPVSAAVALKTLEIYQERDILGHVRAVAPTFQKRLKALGERTFVGEVRGVGLIGAVELVAHEETKAPFDPVGVQGPAVVQLAQENGVITRALADSVAFCPPLIITEAEIHDLFDRVEKSLDAWTVV